MIQEKETKYTPLLLMLARRADSLCSILPSWTASHGWGDPRVYHCPYQLLTHLTDMQSDQLPILIARPVMFTEDFVTAVLPISPSLRLIAWNTVEQTATDHRSSISEKLPVATVSSPHELSNLINTLLPTAINSSEPTAAPETTNRFDPEDYKLSNDEIGALLGVDK